MRLIDADVLKNKAYDGGLWSNIAKGYHQMVVDVEDIDDAPSIDIINCKDCIDNEEGWCLHFGHEVDDHAFCFYGEAMEKGASDE